MKKELSRSFYLTAADCNAQFELPLPLLVQNIVEVATDHANHLGVGYKRLEQDGKAWVLLRLTIELKRMPRVHEHYTIHTWVQAFNRRFSQRNFEIVVGEGDDAEVIGQAMTMWTAINSSTRQAAGLDGLEALSEVMSPRDVVFSKGPRVKPADFASATTTGYDYRVMVSDIDTNRHLTSMRYLQLMLNLWPLDFYDTCHITRFEIAYSTEGHYDDTLTIERHDIAPGEAACRIRRGDETLSIATLGYTPR